MKALIAGILFFLFIAFLGLADALTLRRRAKWPPDGDDDEF